MIVKNEYIKIKTNKEYTLKNYIYDSYLSKISRYQYDKTELSIRFTACYLKIETPLADITNATYEDFDVSIDLNVYGKGNKNTAECIYTLKPNSMYYINEGEYQGKKITAIGFGIYEEDNTIYACVDTSNYSIYFDTNVSIERKDKFTTDAYADIDYPENLSPVNSKTATYISQHGSEILSASTNLYSIGLGTRRGEMQEEYIIGEDIDVDVIDNFSFGFKLRKGLEPNKYPTPTTYAGSLYPLPIKVTREIHPSVNLYAGNKVPLLSDYKYIIYKYEYYDEYQDYGEYFTVSLPNDTKGLFEIVTKIERSDV